MKAFRGSLAARMRQVSQEVLAADAGIDRTYVGRRGRGIENPTAAVLEKIAVALEAAIVGFFVMPAEGEPR